MEQENETISLPTDDIGFWRTGDFVGHQSLDDALGIVWNN
jgi:hypothetical protein